MISAALLGWMRVMLASSLSFSEPMAMEPAGDDVRAGPGIDSAYDIGVDGWSGAEAGIAGVLAREMDPTCREDSPVEEGATEAGCCDVGSGVGGALSLFTCSDKTVGL